MLTTLLIPNIHCAACARHVHDLLGSPHIRNVDVSISDHDVRVRHDKKISPKELAHVLIDGGFDVSHVCSRNNSGAIVAELESREAAMTAPPAPDTHLRICDACRHEEMEKNNQKAETQTDQSQLLGTEKKQDAPSIEYTAQISIGGMTCASCANSISEAVRDMDCVRSVSVELLSNSAAVVFTGRDNANRVVDTINDTGFDAELDSVTAKATLSAERTATLAVGGMTCGSCSAAVRRALEDLPFVSHASVELLSNSATAEFTGDHLAELVSAIEDIGYDCSVVSCIEAVERRPGIRTVSIKVDGMFCRHCPPSVVDALCRISTVVVDGQDSFTTTRPVITVHYTPMPPTRTVRALLAAISAANPAFHPSVWHPPSVEDRARDMQRREQRRLLLRLAFAVTCAIPTFLLGIVFMSLVPSTNSARRYLDQPAGTRAGGVSRREWALLVLATPVMIYGADVFHRRAAAEVWVLWRPGSRVPLARRFLRFGSMNLLVSAGTAVAYLSSLAMLAVTAAQTSAHSGPVKQESYFDSAVFLTMFILAGRTLEAYARSRTGDAVAALARLRPTSAMLEVPSGAESIAVDLLDLGDIVVIPQGASPPADATILPSTTDDIGNNYRNDDKYNDNDDSENREDDYYSFNESSLTGESRPIVKRPGAPVFAGTVNTSGRAVRARVTAPPPGCSSAEDTGAGASLLDQIVTAVRAGQNQGGQDQTKSPVDRAVAAATAYFVPIITLCAIVTFVIWLSLGYGGRLPHSYGAGNGTAGLGGWAFWALEFAVAVFVGACPCGLALAAPTALLVGAGLAARRGALVRGGGAAFDGLAGVQAIVFDKTGTLTAGAMRVEACEILPIDYDDSDELKADSDTIGLVVARAIEQRSAHPVARAIAAYCAGRIETSGAHKLVSVLSADVREVTGMGVRGTVTVAVGSQTRRYATTLGSPKLMRREVTSQNIKDMTDDNYYLSNLLASHAAAARTPAILSLARLPAEPGAQQPQPPQLMPTHVFALSDPPRPDAAAVVASLQSRGIAVHMCTGDNAATARAVAAAVGIHPDRVVAGTLPADKAVYVSRVRTGKVEQGKDIDGTDGADGEARSEGKEDQEGCAKSKVVTVFVGDGTNDAPALAAADVGIAVSVPIATEPSSSEPESDSPAPGGGSTGADIAISAASVILLRSASLSASPDTNSAATNTDPSSSSPLSTLPSLLALARRVRRRVLINIGWAFLYNSILVPVAAGVFYPIRRGTPEHITHFRLNPAWASLAMALSSVSVVCGSLALRVQVEWGEKKGGVGRVWNWKEMKDMIGRVFSRVV